MVIIAWVCQIIMVAILAQTLFFKFTFAPETQYIFARIGGRPAATLTGLAELACVALLLVPRTSALGAVASIGVMMGAVLTHVFVIGITWDDPVTKTRDNGVLFGLALAVALLGGVVTILRRAQLVTLISQIRGQ